MSKKKRKYPVLVALKGRIREKGTSYRELSMELGISVAALSNKINGYYAISGPEMEQIATSLDIDPRDIAHYFMPGYCKTQRRILSKHREVI